MIFTGMPWMGKNGFCLLPFKEGIRSNKWFFSLYLQDPRHARDRVLQELADRRNPSPAGVVPGARTACLPGMRGLRAGYCPRFAGKNCKTYHAPPTWRLWMQAGLLEALLAL